MDNEFVPPANAGNSMRYSTLIDMQYMYIVCRDMYSILNDTYSAFPLFIVGHPQGAVDELIISVGDYADNSFAALVE